LRRYVERFGPDRASADDIVQETFIRAWRHLPQLRTDDRMIRPWLFRVARNLLTDANRAARARPRTVPAEPAWEAGTDSGLDGVLDRQLLSVAFRHLSRAHQSVLLETFYRGGPRRRSLASSVYRTGRPGRGCTTRSMRCARSFKSTTRSRADDELPAAGRHGRRHRRRGGTTRRGQPVRPVPDRRDAGHGGSLGSDPVRPGDGSSPAPGADRLAGYRRAGRGRTDRADGARMPVRPTLGRLGSIADRCRVARTSGNLGLPWPLCDPRHGHRGPRDSAGRDDPGDRRPDRAAGG
jgi:RNA polymerase sigma-70 factor (ECF subfamily)